MSNAARKRGVKINEKLFDINAAASEGFGHDMGLSAAHIPTKQIIKSKPIDIFSIQPSPTQPRRVVPSKYRSGALIEQIERWVTDVERLTGRALPVRQLITGETELRTAPDGDIHFAAAAEEIPLLRLADLAASIHQDGLTNPITVVKSGDGFVIETGERRWVAYHILNAYIDDDDYSAIPARRMDELNLWRQASENTARDALNAIARARQIALLLMDMHGWEHFAPIESFAYEQDFYAQVADANIWRIPYGKSEQLCRACGFENASRIRQYRALLKLTHQQWMRADDSDIPEFELRKWVKSKSVTPVTHSKTQAKPPPILAALGRLDRQMTQPRFERMTGGEQLQAIHWMQAQLERMEKWYSAK